MRFFIHGFRADLEEWNSDLKRLTDYEYFKSVPAAGGEEQRARKRFSRQLDYAFFAARLGWTPQEYGSLTPIERLFVRKELETYTVERIGLIQDAVRLAFVNAWNGKDYRVFKKRIERDQSITDADVIALAAECKRNPPWTPWSNNNG